MITQPPYGGAPTKPNAILSNWNSYRRLLQYHQQGYTNIGFLHPLLLQHRTASPTTNSFRKLAVFTANDYRGLPAQRTTLYRWRITTQTAHIGWRTKYIRTVKILENLKRYQLKVNTSLASWVMEKICKFKQRIHLRQEHCHTPHTTTMSSKDDIHVSPTKK